MRRVERGALALSASFLPSAQVCKSRSGADDSYAPQQGMLLLLLLLWEWSLLL